MSRQTGPIQAQSRKDTLKNRENTIIFGDTKQASCYSLPAAYSSTALAFRLAGSFVWLGIREYFSRRAIKSSRCSGPCNFFSGHQGLARQSPSPIRERDFYESDRFSVSNSFPRQQYIESQRAGSSGWRDVLRQFLQWVARHF